MKKLALLTAVCLLLAVASGCASIFVPPGGGRGETESAATTGSTVEVTGSKVEDFYMGEDRIFYDNTQAVFSYTSSTEYKSVVHAVMQAEALRQPVGYTLQIKNGRTDEQGNLVGFLHWQGIDFGSLKTCFADKSLYTFGQNGQVPRLSDKGPLGLLFEDEVLDAGNLNIIITDMMENNFGASQIAAGLSRTLGEDRGVEIALYGFKCQGFSGNLSYPGYTTQGSAVRTVLNYRGTAAMYILAIGPWREVEAFDSRLREQLPEEVEVHRAVYINGDNYPGYTGLGQLRVVDSLSEKIGGGNSETLNCTVNARLREGSGSAFLFDSSHTAKGAKNDAQVSLVAELAEDSPFIEGGLTAGEVRAYKIEKDGSETQVEIEAYAEINAFKNGLPSWKEGAKRTVALNDLAKGRVLSVQIHIKDMPAGRYRFELELTADMGGDGWIEGYNATVYEYQSLDGLLPRSEENPNHLIWQAGATDILSRTLDLSDVDRLLGDRVSGMKTVKSIAFEIIK